MSQTIESTLSYYFQTILGLMYLSFPILDDEEKLRKAKDKFTPFLNFLALNELSCFGHLDFTQFADHFQLFLRLVEVTSVSGKNDTFDGLLRRIEKATTKLFECHRLSSDCFHTQSCIANIVYPDGETYECDCKKCTGLSDLSVCESLSFLYRYTIYLNSKLDEENEFEMNADIVPVKEHSEVLQSQKRSSLKRDAKRFDSQKNPEKKVRRSDRISSRKITKGSKCNRFDLSVY